MNFVAVVILDVVAVVVAVLLLLLFLWLLLLLALLLLLMLLLLLLLLLNFIKCLSMVMLPLISCRVLVFAVINLIHNVEFVATFYKI